MLRSLVVLAAFAATAAAQFPGPFSALSTTYDGSLVYFTSDLKLKGTDQSRHGKIFVADENGVRLFRSRPKVIPPDPTITGCNLGPYFDYFGTDVSGDGRVVAGYVFRSWSGYCTHYLAAATDLITPAGETDTPGIVRLSPNGRYAFAALEHGATLTDLETGAVTPVRVPASPYGIGGIGVSRTVANDGTTVFLVNWALVIAHASGDVETVAARFPAEGGIDAAASTVVYATALASTDSEIIPPRLVALDVRSRTEVELAKGGADTFSMSDDGRRVAYVQAGRLYVVNTDGSGLRAATDATVKLTAAVLSGNGKVAYATTGAGGLIKVDVEAAVWKEIIGPTPYLDPRLSVADAGMAFTVIGTGLSDTFQRASPPLNTWLGNVTMWIGERKVPVLEVAPDHIRFLVPWDVPAGPNTVFAEVSGGGQSMFEGSTGALTISTTPRTGAIYHEDWQRTYTGPVRAGEILHVYAIGLGPVLPEVPAGQLAPSAEPLARLAQPLVCPDADVLYAGLAPGALERVYQVDIRLNRTGYHLFQCTSGGTPSLALTLNVVP